MRQTLLAATFLCLSGLAFAQTVPTVPPLVTDEPAMVPDGPTKSAVPDVVATGKIQIETDLLNWTNNGRLLFTNPTIKYGIAPNFDIEANMVPYERIQGTNKWGVGDLYLRAKWHIFSDDKWSIALIPYIKVPTATPGIGNGFVEGGFITPVSYTLPLGFTFLTDPEIDQFHNATGTGYYTNFQITANVSHTLFTDSLLGMVEFWQQLPLANSPNLGILGHQQQSINFGVVYSLTPTWQFDVVFNQGLTESTPKQQVYFGFATRF